MAGKKRFEKVEPGPRNLKAYRLRRLDAMLERVAGATVAVKACNRDFARCALRYAREISRYEKERKRFEKLFPDDEGVGDVWAYDLEAKAFVDQLRALLTTQLEQLDELRGDVAKRRGVEARRKARKVRRWH